ncbi:hypothetical protein [Streptomyces griseoluteus]|uniref:hypothetical protein n=1 Tax=Streptomyces griseoluteus TaxID=29306 RepID=UPI003821199D
MAITSSRAQARAIRFVLVVGSGRKRYAGGNIPVPEGVDAFAFASEQAMKLIAPGQWVVWSDGDRPIIFPARAVQCVETVYLDRV